MKPNPVNCVYQLGMPWVTQNPFLFCVYHQDNYPKGNAEMGPVTPLDGRNLGNDFVKKEGWRMYHGEKVPGFPAHPHRGFETVTFVLKGMVDHADSNGSSGRYGNRDVQWMTAGSGLQHSEMFPLLSNSHENPFELFQIWLNLPSEKKFTKPFYKMLWGETIPKITVTDKNRRITEIDVVAGKINSTKAPDPAPDSWAANPKNEVAIWQIKMEKNATWEIPAASKEVNRSLYFFEGESIQLNEYEFAGNYVAELDASQKVTIQNGNKNSRLLLLQGKPIHEPVVQYGPFVMNTPEEIQQAFNDFQRTRFGGWPWPRPDMVHEKNKGRFARYDDGTETVKD